MVEPALPATQRATIIYSDMTTQLGTSTRQGLTRQLACQTKFEKSMQQAPSFGHTIWARKVNPGMHKIKTPLTPPFYVPFPNYLQAELSQICLHKCAVSLQKEFPKNEIPTPKPQKFKLNLIALKK